MRIAGDGAAGVGLLDFQDAGIGPIAYDLVSLLEDARRDVPERVQRAMLARHRAAFATLDVAGFEHSYAVLGAIRHARIIGRVAELAAGGTARQLDFLPRVWGQFEAKLAQPALAPVRHCIDLLLPGDRGLGRVMERAA
jgi:aminoglycoside/choline kinase family phosphotransferase